MNVYYKSHLVRMELHVLTLTMGTSVIVLITGAGPDCNNINNGYICHCTDY